MKKTLLNKNSRTNLITYLVVIVAFAVMQTLSSHGKLGSAVTGYLVPVCCYIVLAVSLNLLVGVCGELSLGHAGFMGVGAFSGVILATMLKDSIPSPVLRLVLAMVFGGVLAGVLGFLIGIPVLRLQGDYLAIVTLAFGEIMKNLIGNMYVGTDDSGFRMVLATAKPKLIGKGHKWILSGAMGITGIKRISTFAVGFGLVLFTLFYHRIFDVTFDENFAKAAGTRVDAANLLIAVITAVIIVLAMNLVGSLLISALIIFPALSAMRIFRSFLSVTVFSAVISVTCAFLGIIISILAGTPVGSTVVAVDVAAFAVCAGIGAAKGT